MHFGYQQSFQQAVGAVLFTGAEGGRGIAPSLTACAVSLRTLYRGYGGRWGGAGGAGGRVQGCAPEQVHCLSGVGLWGLWLCRAKSQKMPTGATKTDPHPSRKKSLSGGGCRACRGGLPQHYYHLRILITFVVY